jgi:simple sugar transport system permease protein
MANNNSFIEKLKGFWDRNVAKNRLGQLFIVLIVITIFFIITEDKFFRWKTYESMLLQMSELGILAIGVFLCILVGGLNISIMGSANLSALMAGLFILSFAKEGMAESQVTMVIVGGFLTALLVGFLCGLFNGVIVGYFRLPPLLATLGTGSLFIGLFKGITSGESIFGYPAKLEYIGGGQILGIPVPFYFFFVITILMFFLLRYTKFGYRMYMTGANETTAIFSGIDTRAVILKTYIVAGMLSSVTGMIILGRTMSANYDYGAATYVLFTIFVAVISGSRAGFGSVINMFVAMFALQTLQTGFNYLLQTVRGNTYFRDFIWGVLLIVFLIINYFTNVKKVELN